jgi:hypothetical protein
LPESDLEVAVLAPLTDKAPSPREALAWVARRQTWRRRT